ncbi:MULTISPECIES: protein kinase domain-containing protein [unclassified Arsukibacterium]|uniref:protein kinase domain-containing protein n=1 Tax=unclassified Arsukibacterium TaxID=2635278 RepID=UPI000C651083|nr:MULTISPECIES: serine/threonine protein kinase [unclassified Arsukibacterium]MAA94021.1 serine/threonine protein kinase [Rheinheimera sp.]MBM33394.1 serine/threonine protein kinase [Rheinheimera sp.]HAW92543.1 serine/threonine protein kinase [Candidatus Azambacteria bacterium]|tara:strand:- start:12573 stop:14411 length:1839 start_codon:yes stop_codon:yes gene_type:complete
MPDKAEKIPLRNFYIPEEQSVYLLNANDAKKLKDWVALCIEELEKLGYRQIELIGKGAYGFAFAGLGQDDVSYVFKFSRINLAPHIQERLADEAYMLSLVNHPAVPAYVTYQVVRKQGILMMGRATGLDLEQYSLKVGRLPVRLLIDIAGQLAELLLFLRQQQINGNAAPIVHGDIKPSNLVFDEQTGKISLIDWGSSVHAQLDSQGQYLENNVMQLMSADLQHSNARMGDVYFIGPEQRTGALSSPRFDEQGIASTLYALASAQSCRFGRLAIPARSLGLPVEFATMLDSMLADDQKLRQQAGDYFIARMPQLIQLVLPPLPILPDDALLPVWCSAQKQELDTVVYSSRKSFLREHQEDADLHYVDDVQLERYYKNYLEGMGETEKAFIAAVGRLARYPVVGGLAIHWQADGVYIDSSLNLYNESLKVAFSHAVNNVVILGRAIGKLGVFKACLFDARNTIHISRESTGQPFIVPINARIPYQRAPIASQDEASKQHSYFEDGKDPDEQLVLPEAIMDDIAQLNLLRHTGCIIFEVTSLYMKVHSYYRLLDSTAEPEFSSLLASILSKVPLITGEGVGGFMKLPYKDTRFFEHQPQTSACYYPANPMQFSG